MKKLALLVILCIAISHNASAVFGIKLGPEVGMNLSTFRADAAAGFDTKSLAGLRIGLVADLHIFKPIYVQVGALYSMQGTSIETSSGGVTFTGKEKVNYLNIPISLMYKHNLVIGKVFVGVGPYFGYALSAKAVVAGISQKLNIGSDAATDDIKRMDVGLGFNAGFQFKLGAFVRLQYQLGLSELSPDAALNGSMKSGNFQVSVGWLFL